MATSKTENQTPEAKGTRESFDKKVDRLLAAPLPTNQKELIAVTSELGKLSGAFDKRIEKLQAAVNALASKKATVTKKMGECYINLGQQFQNA